MNFTNIEQVAAAVKAEGMYWSQGGQGSTRYYQVQTVKPLDLGVFIFNNGETVCKWSNKQAVLDWANDWLA